MLLRLLGFVIVISVPATPYPTTNNKIRILFINHTPIHNALRIKCFVFERDVLIEQSRHFTFVFQASFGRLFDTQLKLIMRHMVTDQSKLFAAFSSFFFFR